MPRLRRNYAIELPVMGDFLEQIEQKLDSAVYDRAEPSLEPALSEARRHVGRARAFVGELCWLTEEEHSGMPEADHGD